MKEKHIAAHLSVCEVQASLSPCPRRKVGAVLVDPVRNTILSTGYNGTPRGAPGPLCGGACCDRDVRSIPSGTHMEVGCHHAEMNAIANAAARGTATDGAWMFTSVEPCAMCAKMMHHAGISRVLCIENSYAGGSDGTVYLRQHGVEVEHIVA